MQKTYQGYYFRVMQTSLFLLMVCFVFILTIIKADAQDSLLAQQLKQYVVFLASDSLKGRFAGTREGHIAANFIAQEMQQIGLKPVEGFDGFYAPFLYHKDTLRNVMGAIAGTTLKDEVVIFSAHYDHVGTKSTNPYPYFHTFNNKDTIYNGANDDASGIAVLLALANLIMKDTAPPLRNVFFIAFDGEESGELGSNYFAALFHPDHVAAVINLEMLGIPAKGSPFITATQFSNIRDVLNNTLEQANDKLYGKHFFNEDKYPEQKLWQRSDNFPFLQRKMAAHTIMVTSPGDPLYHSAKDEAHTLDYTYMAKLVEAIKIATAPLINEGVRLKTKFK
jgi:Zn-dependent M28 family amino/carboxypeptidase